MADDGKETTVVPVEGEEVEEDEEERGEGRQCGGEPGSLRQRLSGLDLVRPSGGIHPLNRRCFHDRTVLTSNRLRYQYKIEWSYLRVTYEFVQSRRRCLFCVEQL